MSAAGERELTYFLHIPKTAGTSLNEFLRRVEGPGRVATQLIWDDLAGGALPEGARVIGGHFGGLLPVWLNRWPRVLTVVRNPVARALSHINHVQRSPDHPLHRTADGLAIVEYCRHPLLRTTVDNLQARYLASLSFARAVVPRPGDAGGAFGSRSVAFEAALSALDPTAGLRGAAVRALDDLEAVGVCERFAATVRLFARVLGWQGEFPEPRLNTAAEGQKSVRDLAPEELAALAECNAIDLDVYRHAWARFRELCGRHGIDTDDAPAADPSRPAAA
jgi:hypothetical protein